jgi:hypothetical protein
MHDFDIRDDEHRFDLVFEGSNGTQHHIYSDNSAIRWFIGIEHAIGFKVYAWDESVRFIGSVRAFTQFQTGKQFQFSARGYRYIFKRLNHSIVKIECEHQRNRISTEISMDDALSAVEAMTLASKWSIAWAIRNASSNKSLEWKASRERTG